MKTNLVTIITIILITGLFSCEKKDVLEDPVACFTANTNTISRNEYVTFHICGDAMHNVIFGGDFLSVFNGLDSINGQGYPVIGDSVIVKYIRAGEYQPWLVSTNANYKGIKRDAVPLGHTIIVID
jgi:hypothetical protein